MRLTKIVPIILVLSTIPVYLNTLFAGELIHPRLGATYVKLTDGTRRVSLSLSASIDDKRVNILNAPLEISVVDGSEKTLVGRTVTDQKGKAVLDIKQEKSIPADKEGYFNLEILYPGNEKFESASKSLHLKDISMEITFSEKDSLKYVHAHLFTMNEMGMKKAVRDVPVEFYINRLFCLYRFGGEKTDSSGVCMVEFPKNMPGDTAGNVSVVAKIVENDDFGTVEKVSIFNGGTPLVIEPKQKRGLGDTDAPLWMVYTLLVLLSGVWLHVLYVLGLVIRINLIGKKTLSLSGK